MMLTVLFPASRDLAKKPAQLADKKSMSEKTIGFVEKARLVHAGKGYDYSKAVYIDPKAKVKIICPLHGDFEQIAHIHLKGHGCQKCGIAQSRVNKIEKSRSRFFTKAKLAHPDQGYDYSKSVYLGATTKLTITCLIHGDFKQTPDKHLQGHGCQKCGLVKPGDKLRFSACEFIEKSNAIHIGKGYSYLKSTYTNSQAKLIITCPTHGDFEQLASSHMQGKGCKKCAVNERADKKRLSLADFIKKAKEANPGKDYTYGKAVYTSYFKKLTITCAVHGDFEQTPAGHLGGHGCPKCAFITRITKTTKPLNKFIEEAKSVHNGKGYSYGKAVYSGAFKKLTITCPIHGDFEQSPDGHLSGRICHACSLVESANARRFTLLAFVEKANSVHVGKGFTYERAKYFGQETKLTITCPIHGDFEQVAGSHLVGRGCAKCVGNISNGEVEVAKYIESLGFQLRLDKRITDNWRDVRFDIIVESKKLVVEFNGVYWHSIANRERDYHIKKRELAESLGYEMLSIWQDDYESKKDKIEALLRRKLLGAPHRIFARKTSLLKLTPKQALAFHSEHHLQETKPATAGMHYALAYDNKIIAAASFDKTGVLHRYTIKIDTALIGGMAKLIAAYRADVGNVPITTYCDKDYFSGGLYAATGFKKVSETLQLTYLHRNRRVRRENFMKHKLPGFFGEVNMTKTEMQICLENKVYACFNSGVEKLVLPAN
jgi:hypothetical protein